MGTKEKKEGWSLKYMMKAVGPALLISGVTLGPSSLVNSVNTGSNFGFSLIWWLFFICMIGAIYQITMNRYSIVTGKTFCTGIREKHGPVLSFICGLTAIAQSGIFMIGNFVGSGLAVGLIFPKCPVWLGGGIIFIISFLFLLFKNLYNKLESLFKVLLFVMLGVFVVILIVSDQADPTIVSTKIVDFSNPSGTLSQMLTLLGATVSLSTCAWATSLSQDKGYTLEDIKKGGIAADAFVGNLITFAVCAVLMLVGARAFGGNPIVNGSQFGFALGDLYGVWARYLVGIGFISICLSTVVVCPQAGASVMLQSLGKSTRMDSKNFKFTIGVTAVMFIVAAIVGTVVGGAPASVLKVAAWAGIIGTPFFGIFTITLLTDKEQMKEYAISKKHIALLVVLYIIMMAVIVFKIKNQIVSLF